MEEESMSESESDEEENEEEKFLRTFVAPEHDPNLPTMDEIIAHEELEYQRRQMDQNMEDRLRQIEMERKENTFIQRVNNRFKLWFEKKLLESSGFRFHEVDYNLKIHRENRREFKRLVTGTVIFFVLILVSLIIYIGRLECVLQISGSLENSLLEKPEFLVAKETFLSLGIGKPSSVSFSTREYIGINNSFYIYNEKFKKINKVNQIETVYHISIPTKRTPSLVEYKKNQTLMEVITGISKNRYFYSVLGIGNMKMLNSSNKQSLKLKDEILKTENISVLFFGVVCSGFCLRRSKFRNFTKKMFEVGEDVYFFQNKSFNKFHVAILETLDVDLLKDEKFNSNSVEEILKSIEILDVRNMLAEGSLIGDSILFVWDSFHISENFS